MPPKKQKIFHDPITSKEHFEQIISENPTRLNMIDFHLEWCGPCKCMEENYKAMWFSHEDGDALGRLAFWQCSEEMIPDEWVSKVGELTLKPRFCFIQGGQLKKTVDGARLSILEENMFDLIPDCEE